MLDHIPEGMTEDTELLFVSPYHPEDMEEAMLSGGGEDLLIKAFENAARRDPDIENYYATIEDIAFEFGLTAYIAAQDVAFFDGDKDKLAQAYDKLCETYYCHYNTIGSFVDFNNDPDIEKDLDIPEKKPRLN